MWYISKIFQGTKLAIAGIGSVMSVLMIGYGTVQIGGTIYVIGGTFFLISSIFHLFDGSKASIDIRNQVNGLTRERKELETQNRLLGMNVDHLTSLRQRFVDTSKSLSDTAEKSAKKVEELDSIRKKLEEQLAKRTEVHEKEMRNIILLKNQLSSENQQYQQLMSQYKIQLQELQKTKDNYTNEVQKLATENSHLTSEIVYLKQQLEKLVKLYDDTKKLLVQLASIGDRYTDFSSHLDDSIIKFDTKIDDLDSVSSQLTNLLLNMKNKKFEELDEDGDGFVTRTEFNENL